MQVVSFGIVMIVKRRNGIKRVYKGRDAEKIITALESALVQAKAELQLSQDVD